MREARQLFAGTAEGLPAQRDTERFAKLPFHKEFAEPIHNLYAETCRTLESRREVSRLKFPWIKLRQRWNRPRARTIRLAHTLYVLFPPQTIITDFTQVPVSMPAPLQNMNAAPLQFAVAPTHYVHAVPPQWTMPANQNWQYPPAFSMQMMPQGPPMPTFWSGRPTKKGRFKWLGFILFIWMSKADNKKLIDKEGDFILFACVKASEACSSHVFQ
jgi:hypothetical protein